MDTSMIGGIIRALLAALGGGLLTSGVVSSDDLNIVAGAVATLVAAAWSIYQKYRANKA